MRNLGYKSKEIISAIAPLVLSHHYHWIIIICIMRILCIMLVSLGFVECILT